MQFSDKKAVGPGRAGALLCALLAVGLAACGSTPVAAQPAATATPSPSTLRLTVTRPLNSPPRILNGQDATAVQALYQHILIMTKIPPNAGIPCHVSHQRTAVAFLANSAVVLDAAITQCDNLLQVSDRTTRAVDAAFWNLLNTAVAQTVGPTP